MPENKPKEDKLEKELTESQRKLIVKNLESVNESIDYVFQDLKEIYATNSFLMRILIKDLG